MPRQYEPSELILAAALRESVAGRIWHPSTQVHRSGGGGASWKGGGGERGERGERVGCHISLVSRCYAAVPKAQEVCHLCTVAE